MILDVLWPERSISHGSESVWSALHSNTFGSTVRDAACRCGCCSSQSNWRDTERSFRAVWIRGFSEVLEGYARPAEVANQCWVVFFLKCYRFLFWNKLKMLSVSWKFCFARVWNVYQVRNSWSARTKGIYRTIRRFVSWTHSIEFCLSWTVWLLRKSFRLWAFLRLRSSDLREVWRSVSLPHLRKDLNLFHVFPFPFQCRSRYVSWATKYHIYSGVGELLAWQGCYIA